MKLMLDDGFVGEATRDVDDSKSTNVVRGEFSSCVDAVHASGIFCQIPSPLNKPINRTSVPCIRTYVSYLI